MTAYGRNSARTLESERHRQTHKATLDSGPAALAGPIQRAAATRANRTTRAESGSGSSRPPVLRRADILDAATPPPFLFLVEGFSGVQNGHAGVESRMVRRMYMEPLLLGSGDRALKDFCGVPGASEVWCASMSLKPAVMDYRRGKPTMVS